MYLMKTLRIDKQTDSIDVENGIPCALINGKLIAYDEFWGKTEIICGNYADWDKIKKNTNDEYILSYCNEINAIEDKDGFKKLLINTSVPNSIDGFIIFIKYTNDPIKTNGEKLFGRYPNEGIFILKNDQEIILDNHKIKVFDSSLYLNI